MSIRMERRRFSWLANITIGLRIILRVSSMGTIRLICGNAISIVERSEQGDTQASATIKFTQMQQMLIERSNRQRAKSPPGSKRLTRWLRDGERSGFGGRSACSRREKPIVVLAGYQSRVGAALLLPLHQSDVGHESERVSPA